MTYFGNCDPTFWGFECCHECGLQKTVAWIEPQCPLLTQCLVRFPNPLADWSVPFKLFKSGGDPVYPGPALGRGVPTQECEFHFDSDQPEIPSFCNIAREHEITYQLTVALKDSKENLEFDLCFNLTKHWIKAPKMKIRKAFFLVKSWTVHTPQYLID